MTQSDADRVRAWRKANPTKVKMQKQRHTAKYIDREVARIEAWKSTNPIRVLEYGRAYSKRDDVRAKQTKYRQDIKQQFIDAYGGSCSCCGETDPIFLTGDHVNGRQGDEDKGHKFYVRVKREGYPQGKYRALCWNCNAAYGLFGRCPHQDEQFSLQGLAC